MAREDFLKRQMEGLIRVYAKLLFNKEYKGEEWEELVPTTPQGEPISLQDDLDRMLSLGEHSSCVSRRSIDRPILYSCISFLGFTALFLPLYDRLLKNIPLAQTRCLVVGGILLGILLLIQLVRFVFRKKRKIMAVLSFCFSGTAPSKHSTI